MLELVFDEAEHVCHLRVSNESVVLKRGVYFWRGGVRKSHAR